MSNYWDKLSNERKKLQEDNLLPEWYTTAGWQLFKDRYLWAETPRKQYETIAATLAIHTDDVPKWRDKFFSLLWSGWLSPSTPVLANTGTTRGLPVSCSGGYIPDSIDGFYRSRREAALLSKHGFGTSGYLGDIRGRGDDISSGGKASGVMPVLKGFVQDSRDVSQGGVRRGSWAGYLPIDHMDYWEVVGHLEKEPDDLNIGWNISDDFMAKLNTSISKMDDAEAAEARKRFSTALKVKLVTGKGYFWFPDKANRKLPKYYPISNKASNLCVVPETKILTKKGYVEIQSVVNQEVEVWNGEEWATVTPRTTSYVPVPVVKVTTNSSSPIECTPEHIFYVQNDYHKFAVPVAAKDLQPGDKLIKFDLPVISGPAFENQFAYQSGFFTGDGCHYNGNNVIYLYGKKRELFNLFQGVAGNVYVQEEQDRIVLSRCHGLWEKFYVPDVSWSVGTRLSWLSGLMDADGTVVTNGDNQSLQLASVNRKFLEELQLMLQTLGVNAKVAHARDEGKFELPANDGTGALKEYDCQEVNRLLISSSGLYTLAVLGFNTRRLEWKARQPQRNAEQFVKVVSVVDEGRTSITMCFTEPKRHMGMFNGILTGQCSEILLPSDEQHTYTCVLSSMNVAKYDEWKDTDAIFTATVFLDCVASEFIARAKGIPGLENAVRFTEKGRALGLGVAGFHTYLQQKRIAIDSLDAVYFNQELFQKLNKESLDASLWMAAQWGMPQWVSELYDKETCKQVRNCSRLAVAPTKSTALIMGGISEGINPDPAYIYTQSTAGGEMARINPIILEIMKDRGVYDKKHMQEVIDKFGSVQHVDWLDDEEKKVFRTAFEIDQNVLVHLASQRGKYLDQWQSVNLFFSAEEDPKYIVDVHKTAFNDENIIGLYYIYSKSGISGSRDCEVCS